MPVTGTDIWYYFICQREVWLNKHQITPDQEDENIEIGRFIHEYRYGREKKEVAIDAIKIDRMKKESGELVVKEVKKSSKFVMSARHQLAFYLYTLRQMGISARGELLFPEEKKKESVALTDEMVAALEEAIGEIRRIAKMPVPPPPKKINLCRQCGYREYCWAEG
ncbi:CRISPR-associated protein Cas4 [Numidum massiliense]|uniref:CRISPR-associated protein Cas4 n=1 Tax=Numidum massiliense TaxID=1522315 RepID=UPI0006D5731D|nr:CRISPR-associated protein Cas4 [Numidum massiliense]